MNYPHLRKRLMSLVAAVSLIALVALTLILSSLRPPSAAAETEGYSITLASLQGPWQMTLTGVGGCGFSTNLLQFTLDAAGHGVSSGLYHTERCGDGTFRSYPFTIQTLNPDGSGTANWSCGPGCGWNFIIQVARLSQVFTAIDVDPANPGNFLSGTAIRQNRP